jgi:hypothetical protein
MTLSSKIIKATTLAAVSLACAPFVYAMEPENPLNQKLLTIRLKQQEDGSWQNISSPQEEWYPTEEELSRIVDAADKATAEELIRIVEEADKATEAELIRIVEEADKEEAEKKSSASIAPQQSDLEVLLYDHLGKLSLSGKQIKKAFAANDKILRTTEGDFNLGLVGPLATEEIIDDKFYIAGGRQDTNYEQYFSYAKVQGNNGQWEQVNTECLTDDVILQFWLRKIVQPPKQPIFTMNSLIESLNERRPITGNQYVIKLTEEYFQIDSRTLNSICETVSQFSSPYGNLEIKYDGLDKYKHNCYKFVSGDKKRESLFRMIPIDSIAFNCNEPGNYDSVAKKDNGDSVPNWISLTLLEGGRVPRFLSYKTAGMISNASEFLENAKFNEEKQKYEVEVNSKYFELDKNTHAFIENIENRISGRASLRELNILKTDDSDKYVFGEENGVLRNINQLSDSLEPYFFRMQEIGQK